ncbi:hypothetical protein Esti_001746 [Eimeria stiedai]
MAGATTGRRVLQLGAPPLSLLASRGPHALLGRGPHPLGCRGLATSPKGGWGPDASMCISVDELADELQQQQQQRQQQRQRLLILDCSKTSLPMFGGRSALDEFLGGPRIPGALYFDYDVCCDPHKPYPHMMPSTSMLNQYLGFLLKQQQQQQKQQPQQDESGVKVVLYDSVGFFSAARVYWMLILGGWSPRILAGGLKAWLAANLPLETKRISRDTLAPAPTGEDTNSSSSSSKNSMLTTYEELVRDLEEALGESHNEPSSTNSSSSSSSSRRLPCVLADTRPRERFLGLAKDKEGLFSGHMPTAFNVPFVELLEAYSFFPNSSSSSSTGPATYLSPFETSAGAPPFGYAKLKMGAPLLATLGPLLLHANVGGVKQQLLALHQQQQQQFACLDFSEAKRIVCTCGSGVTACMLFCALLQVGYPRSLLSVYDGSWCEWAERRVMEGPEEAGPQGAPPRSCPTLIIPPPTEQQQQTVRELVRARGAPRAPPKGPPNGEGSS